jgi:hypothetical protein
VLEVGVGELHLPPGAAGREVVFQLLDPNDRCLLPPAGRVRVGAPSDFQPHKVGAGLESPTRSPGEAVPPGFEPPPGPEDDLLWASGPQRVGPHDLHRHGRGAVQAEPQDRPVAHAITVRAHGREQPPVPGEGRSTLDAQLVQSGTAAGEEQRQGEPDQFAGRIRTPSRRATNGRLEPWTTTEKRTTTNTIS